MLITLLLSSWKSANSQRWGWKDKEETIEGLRDKWCLRELDILFLAAPFFLMLSSVSSVTQSCPNFCNLMDYSTPDFCVCHQIPGAYTNSCTLSRWCHPIISSSVVPFCSCLQSFPASGSFQMSQLFTSGGKVLEFQLQHQSFQWTPRTDLLYDGSVGSPCSPRDSQGSSPTPQFKSINSSALSCLYGSTLTAIHDHWENHSLD